MLATTTNNITTENKQILQGITKSLMLYKDIKCIINKTATTYMYM